MRGDAYPEEVAVDSVVARLRTIPGYVSLFREVYGQGTSMDAAQVAEAIAAFERTLVTRNSPFDRFLAGDEDALTVQQRRGLEEFDEADCSDCHDGPMLSDFRMQAEGVAENPLLAEPDAGTGGSGSAPLPSATSPSPHPTCTTGCWGRWKRFSPSTTAGGRRTPTSPTGGGGAAMTIAQTRPRPLPADSRDDFAALTT